MKQMKVKIAVMVLLALIVSGINVGVRKAEAENLAVIYGNAVTAEAGQQIMVPVLIKDNQGRIAGLALKVTYDTNSMAPIKTEKGKILSGFSNIQFGDTIATSEKPGSFECVAYNEENYSDNGELFIMTFQISDSAVPGSYELKLELTEHFDERQDDVPVECENIIITVSGAANPTQKPTTPIEPVKTVYVFEGMISGWGGPESYPSSAGHDQGDGESNCCYPELTNMKYSRGYGCGLELMNPYNALFTGAENEMSQFIKKMKQPRIKVTLENGGSASSWNWKTELCFPSGKEIVLPDEYLDTDYFALFGNDDVITKVEIYDVGESGDQTTGNPIVSQRPNESGNAGNTGNNGNQSIDSGQKKNTSVGSVVRSQSKTKKIKKPAKVSRVKLIWEFKKLYVQWNGKSSNAGYQVQCAQNRKFTKKKKIKNCSIDMCRFSGLKKGKTYYVRIRAYKKASGRKIYGKWSKVKKIKIRHNY